ncbi:MAG: OstA-like protein, partial [Bacteroidales bacterium]
MRYKLSLFFILFFILFSNLHAQKKINYKASWSDKRPSFPDELIMVDKVEFEHEDMKMYCDSAIFNEKENRFTAFGNIYINQKDTLKIWGDELYYDGQTKVAELIGKKIKMKDKNLILETDYLVLERLLNTVRYT